MFAALTPEQHQLVDVSRRLAGDLGCPNPSELPHDRDDPAAWTTLVEAGLVAMHLEEAVGGGGAHSADVALVVEQLATQTCLVPFLGQGVLAPELARRGGADVAVLGSLAAGERRLTVALSADLRGLATMTGAPLAFDARGATHGLVLDGRRLLAVPIEGRPFDQADVTRVAHRLAMVSSDPEVIGHLSIEAETRFLAFALAMLAADLVGVADAALRSAIDYVRERRQFGVAVGSFQAVQHLAADAAVALEAARSSMWHAAWAADELGADDALIAARQAKAVASRAALEVVEAQTQLFGGIAITWEERAHVRVRRALLDRVVLGDEHVHYDAIATARLGARV